MRNGSRALCYGSTANCKVKSTTKKKSSVFLWLYVQTIHYANINLLLCSSLLLCFPWPNSEHISRLYLTLKICSDSLPALSILAGYQSEKKNEKVNSYIYLQSFGFLYHWMFHRRSRGNNLFQNISMYSFPSQMFTNWSRPPRQKQVTHCRGMQNLSTNCCIFCSLYLHFSRRKKKKNN